MPQGPPERPGWQVRISWAMPGPGGAAVEAGVPAGGGVWVGDRWVLTCAHVLGPEPRTVMVRFSFAGGEPVPATVAPHGWLAEQDGDLALLELDRDPPTAARPAPLRPARAVTGHACAAYGYPAGLDGGVFSEPEITGQTPDRLQLTAQDSHGHQIERGFSGTGLFDTETSAVVGLVVTRDRGKDVLGGFAIPLQTVVAVFPQLAPWAGWRLGTDRFLRQHWRPRARGVSQDTTPGWYFTGRTALLRELTRWLEDGPPGRAVRVVTGPAGTGKSAVLAWLCAVSDPQLRAEIATALPDSLADTAAVPAAGRVSAAVWARGMDARDAAGALAAALMLPVAVGAPVEDVLAAAKDLDPAERGGLVVVLDALDEARATRDIARQVLVPLTRDLGVKVLVGSRPGRDEELLASFGERAVIYRLDDPAWFDRHDLADYAAACLRADFDPDLASGYRTAPGACEQVAAAIAEAAGSNFLVAGLAARTRADEPVIDVSVPGWRARQRFPAEVGQAFDDYLARFGDDETRARDLLRAVAYAEGPGLPPGDLWAGMATALAAPRRYGTDDVAWLLDSAAGYLVESGGENGKPTYRIFHQALIEHLRPEGKEAQRQRDLVGALMGTVPPGTAGPDWAGAPPYIRRHLAAHAAAAGLLDDLLEDPLYLLTVDPPRLVPYLDTARSGPGRAAAAVYRQSAHILTSLDRSMRASQLELTAHELGCRSLAAGIAGAAPDRPWQTSWSHGRRAVGHQVITGHTGFNRVCAAVGALPDGTPVIVSGGDDRTVRVWRLADGTAVGEPITGHDGMVTAVAVEALPDGTPIIVSGGDDRTVRVWRLADGAPVGEPLRGHTSAVGAVAVGALPDGTPIIVSGGADGDNTVRVWRLADGAPVGEPLRGHDSAVGAVAVEALPDGTPVIVTGGMGGTAWVWRIADDTPAGEPLRGHTSAVGAVAVGTLPDGTAVIVTGGRDGTVRVWRLDDRTPVGTPLRGHTSWVGALAVRALPDGTPVIVAGAGDGTVRVWRLDDRAPVGEPLRGHASWVNTVAVGALPDGTPAIVSGGRDGTVRVWRLDDRASVGEPLLGHDGQVKTVAVGALSDGIPAIVSFSRSSSSPDRTVRVWRLADGTPAVEPLRGPTSWVIAVAVGALPDGTPVIVTGSMAGTVWVWRLADDTSAGQPLLGHDSAVDAVAVGALPDGTAVIVAGGRDGTVRVWRLDDRAPVGEPLRGHDSAVDAVAVGALPDGTAVIVAGGRDGTVRVWRLDDRAPVGEPLRGHDGQVKTVAVGALPDGTPVIVTGGRDGTVRVWRLDDRAPVGEPLRGHDGQVEAVAVGALPDGTPVIVTGGRDGTVRVWGLGDDTVVIPPLNLAESVRDVAVHSSVIVTAAGADIAVHQPTFPRPIR